MWRALFATLVMVMKLAAPAAAADFAVKEVSPGVFVHAPPVALVSKANGGDTSNLGFIIGDAAVAVIDTGTTVKVGQALLAAIRARTKLPIAYVINTHMHPDHTLGDAAFAGVGAKFAGHKNLPAALAARFAQYDKSVGLLLGADPVEGLPMVTFDVLVDGELRIDLGNRPLVLKSWPTAHTDNDLTILDEKTGTLFAGDLLFNTHIPVIDGSIKGWIAINGALKGLPAKRAVPGHGKAVLDWPEALAAQSRYLETLAADVRGEIAAGKHIAEAPALSAQSERTNWDLFDDFNPRNATAAFEELEWE